MDIQKGRQRWSAPATAITSEVMTVLKSSTRRDWREAHRKREREGCCRVCGETRDLECAHVIGRRCDVPLTGPRGGEYLYVHPDAIVPLCGAFTENNCHRQYDQRRLDLLPYLHLHEQVRAVEDAGGIESARSRICGGNV